MVSREVVHILPDKTETIVGIVESPADLHLLVETPKYAGTWITKTRKILRHGRGEIRVREVKHPMVINGNKVLQLGNLLWYELGIDYGGKLKSILLNDKVFIGYDGSTTELWKARSISELADIVGKELAYECMRYYEKYLEEFKLPGAM